MANHLLRRLLYYAASVPTLLTGVRNWPALVSLAAGQRGVLELRDGSRFAVRSPMDAWIVKESLLDREYERASVPLERGWSVLDIGAGLGDFSVWAASRAGTGVVHAYEPAPESAALLRANLLLNGCTQVQAFPCAVSSTPGRITLDMSGGVAVQYTTTVSVAGAGNGPSPSGCIRVESITLASALDRLPGGCCDYLKLDTEGAEYDILMQEPPESLERIHHICMEYHERPGLPGHRALAEHFCRLGWQVRVQPSWVRPHLGLMHLENRRYSCLTAH